MNSAPLVSVLIPCYNAEAWLTETLGSVLAQTHSNLEIILVDDGSTDKSLPMARSFSDRGVKVITQANRGASAARNVAVAASRGDWIQYLDADDLLAPEKIAQQLRLATQTGAKSAWCATWTRFTRVKEDADFTPQPLCIDATPLDWIAIKLARNAMMHPAAWLISRELIARAGPWDESLSLDDDGEYFNRIVLGAENVRCCKAAVSYYRSGLAESLSGKKSDASWTSAYRSLELSVSKVLQREHSPRMRQACATAYQRYIFESYPQVLECRLAAAQNVTALGGSSLQPEGGRKFQLARRFLGWRWAKRLCA